MTSYQLKPWARGAFELIAHAEGHLRDGGDFDRRAAHIGFDNAIEVAITAYLALHPIQREGRRYAREQITQWLANYHTKLEFLAQEAQTRGYILKVPCDEIVYYHKIRSEQYHTGGLGVPEVECLAALRTAALDIFGFLFGVGDVDSLLLNCLEKTEQPGQQGPEANETADWLLDNASEPVNIAGQPYRVSEALRAIDPKAYQAVVAAISESRNVLPNLQKKYPNSMLTKIAYVGFVHYEEGVYLKTMTLDGTVTLTDTEFISGSDVENQYFSTANTPDQNADKLVNDFNPYSIINCFELFTEEAAKAVSRSHNASHGVMRRGRKGQRRETTF